VRRRERGALGLVDQPELLLQKESAVERAVGLLDFDQQLEVLGALLLRRLQQRLARALDPAALGRVRALVRVALIAADLVHRVLGQADHMKRIEGDLGPRDRL
jgi:hypothetical protein